MDADAVDFSYIVFFAVKRGKHLLDGFQQVFWLDLAADAFVGPASMIGNAVALIIIPPGLDGFWTELVGLP